MQNLIRRDASFTPMELFARMNGAWFEPRLGYMWQEYDGKTPTTTGGQTVGLLLGLDQQAQLGPELIPDDIFSNSSYWGFDPGWSLSDNKLIGTNLIPFSQASAQLLESKKIYQFEIDVTFDAGSIYFGYATSAVSANGTYVFRARLNELAYGRLNISASFQPSTTCTISRLSVRKILGNHAYQTTAANRPTLQYNGNLPLIRHDSTDVLTATLPDLGGGVFSSAGSVYFSTPQGMSCLHNQSIGTTYNLPAPNTDIYGVVITPARLVPPLEQRLALYMHRLAGLSDADFFWQEQATDGMTGQLLTDDGTILLRG